METFFLELTWPAESLKTIKPIDAIFSDSTRLIVTDSADVQPIRRRLG